jgi:hypothetical protein
MDRPPRGQRVGALAAGFRRDRVVAGDCQHVGQLALFQELPLRAVVPVGLLGGDPAERAAGRDGALDHGMQELRLCLEDPLVRGLRGGEPIMVSRPGSPEVQLPVDPCAALREA